MLPSRSLFVAAFCVLFAGCVCCHDSLPNPCETCIDPICDPCAHMVAEIEYPDVERCDQTVTLGSQPPRKLSDGLPTDFWDITLDEAIRLALKNSRVLKDLGGRVLSSPTAVQTIYNPSITMSQPRTGEEAALSAFDAQYQNSFFANAANQAFNNSTLGGGATVINNDGFNWSQQLQKVAATGTQFSVAQTLNYENSDAPFNTFPNTYTGALQATVRQPLLQGAGVAFNRIAGPTTQVDLTFARGVLLARIDGDISIAQFEQGVRDFVRDVETAYWDLYLAYRTLDAQRSARDSSRTTWQNVKARFEADLKGGEADREAQAREQFYQFEQQVVEALNGDTADNSGLYQAERRLRRMLGLPVADAELLRPADEPIDTPVSYDWHDCLADSLVRRVELREQMWRVKQRELELFAAKNFLLPRLDAVASYRVDGFGDNLTGGRGEFSSLANELFSFEYNQLQAGLQMSMPLGFRRELAGVRHAKLNLCRERAVLQDQEHQVSHNLGEAFVAIETAYESIQLNRERLDAAQEVVDARLALFESDRVNIDALLESQRRLATAEENLFRSRTQYSLAIRDLHFEKGTLLPYNGVRLQEGPWPSQACEQAWYERRRWMESSCETEVLPRPVTLGPFDTRIQDEPNDGFEPSAELQMEHDAQPIVEPILDDLERLPFAESETEFESLPQPTSETDIVFPVRPSIENEQPTPAIDDGFQSAVPADRNLDDFAPAKAADQQPQRLEILRSPNFNQPAIDGSSDPFIDTPGPGATDPANPGPAETNSAQSPRNDAQVRAASYLRSLLDETPTTQP